MKELPNFYKPTPDWAGTVRGLCVLGDWLGLCTVSKNWTFLAGPRDTGGCKGGVSHSLTRAVG